MLVKPMRLVLIVIAMLVLVGAASAPAEASCRPHCIANVADPCNAACDVVRTGDNAIEVFFGLCRPHC